VLASVTLPVRHIDPLAVLLRMRRADEPWFFRECPAEDTAVAALDATVRATFAGRTRFAEAGAWAEKLFADTIAAGEPARIFGGPHAFVAAAFADDAPLTVFIPRRMVARHAGEHTAVANALVGSDTDPGVEAARMLAAHARFADFDYGAEEPPEDEFTGIPAPAFREGEPAYAALVASLIPRVHAGEFHKIVPARAADWERTAPFDTAEALERLRARHPGSHTFSFGLGDGAEWIGATPETLLRVSAGTLRTEALAGTAPRARHAGDDARIEAGLISDDKVRREQRAVTDTLVTRLRELGLEPVFPETPRIVRLAHARHLLTPVTASLPEGLGALTVAGALHPTPAVAGAPRAAALAALASAENLDREHFAGASGWLDARGDAHLQVNLRCACIRKNHARLYAGAGIVTGSVPEAEAAETTLKLLTVAEALA
jgi:menaquinone-specific isochorismate synthase